MSDDTIRALYCPETREVACVIIQAMAGGDRRACNFVQDWNTSASAGYVMITGTVEEWRKIGMTPKDQRPGPEHFPRTISLTG